ncbi:MAG: LptE family protein [Gemmatimonadota bacterium]
MSRRTRRISGTWGSKAPRILGLFFACALAGCNYTFQAGAGLPNHVQTLAVIPFENETDRFELTEELHQRLVDQLPRSFGVRTGGEDFAEAVVRGRILRYSVDTPQYRPDPSGGLGAQIIERQVLLTVEVQVIDQVNNLILWENSALAERGEFLEESQFEEDGRELAITRIVQSIIDGLQSNW